MSQLAFDEDEARQIEALYLIGDAERRRGIVRAALGARPGDRILDVGCGPGFYCAELLEQVGSDGSVVGVDSSPAMLALAARRCQGHDNVSFHEADALSVPVEDRGFDGAVCVQVLEYVPDVAAALSEMHRALRVGGRLVVWDVDWATLSWHSANPARMERVVKAWDEHLVHRSLPRTLPAELRSAGFEDVRMEAHAFATSELDPDNYGVALAPFIANYVGGTAGITDEEAGAWASEQRELGERGELFFSCTQFCFTATRKR
jgi:ubiquinone/menaquinone biosynthesis C-methylase UbiE